MSRLAVISNPRSQRNRQGALAGLNALLAGHPEVHHKELWNFDDLGSMIIDLMRDDVEVIAVNGGDGTVQAVLTELGRRNLNGKAPKLAVLAGGMTNVIAKDVGLDGAPSKGLQRLLNGKARQETTRPLIGLTLRPDEPPVYGMFFGAAGFYQAVKIANDRVRSKRIAGNIASASTLVLSLGRLLLGRSNADDPLYRGEPMTIGLDGEQDAERPYLLLIATTLDRLMLGLSPFWSNGGCGDGCGIDDGRTIRDDRSIRDDRTNRNGRAIRYTSIDFPPKRLARALLPVLRGKPTGWMDEAGYRSGTADDIVINIKSPVVLDGEIFHPDPSIPVRLTGDRCQRFVQAGGSLG